MSSSLPLPPLAFDARELERIRARLRSLSRRRLKGDAPKASVLVPLCHVGGIPSVLFTKRSERVGTHKGQVSFPGGRMDPCDRDEVACALREGFEEVGIAPEQVEVLGLAHEALSITGVRVTPVVGFVGELGDLSSLRISAAEIDLAFSLSLQQLVAPASRVAMDLGARGRIPTFTAGPEPVWGLTAVILDEVLREGLGLSLPPL